MKRAFRVKGIETATVCDRGLVRAENQDSWFSAPESGVFMVADGMGGGQGGAQASALVVEAFRAELDAKGDFAARLESVQAAVAAANGAVRAYALRAGFRQTGSTVATLLLGDEVPGSALAVWVGDSRVYRFRAGEVRLMTSDHTVANEIFGRKARGEIGYSRTMPYAHVLTRALGVDLTVCPEARRFDVRPCDRFLVCSDGVHDMLEPARLAQIVTSAVSPQAAVEALAEAIRAAGAIDNFTATAVFLRGVRNELRQGGGFQTRRSVPRLPC